MILLGRVFVLGFAAALLFSTTACRTTYYKTMEKFGVYKRDLLKKNVEEARDEQKKATEQFKDALTRLKELYQFEGGDLEKTYDRLKADYERSASRAEAVKERIEKVETVASDLFKEWEKEIETMQSARLAAQSREKLRSTREKYQSLHAAMKRAEASMDPVLAQFNDQVLYLKHNLNAAAIGALKGETLDIEKEIEQLIRDMNASIRQADAFIQGLE
jgi:uncharacterized protein (DUF3084 family)